MNWTFQDLYYGACEDIRDTSTDLQALAKRWANEILDDVYTRRPWNFAIRQGHILTTENVMRYSLPAEMDGILAIYQKESRRFMNFRDAAMFQQDTPDPTQTGNPNTAIDYGIIGAYQQPESTISFVSTSAADTMVVTVTGESGGWEQTGTVTLTGIVSAATTKTFSRYYSAVAASAVTGTVTIKDDASQTIGTIAAAGTTATITAQPSSKITFSSSSTADVTATTSDVTKRIRIGGFSGAGVSLLESIDLTGTTAALTTNYYNRIEQINKYATLTGTVTGTINGAARTAVSLAPLKFMAEYLQIGFYPIPNATLNIFITYRCVPQQMIVDQDTFYPIPQKYFPVLKDGLLRNIWDYLKMPSKSAEHEARYERGIAKMIRDDMNRVPTETIINPSADNRDVRYPRTVSLT